MMIYLCLMAEAFFGYLLPWGQMSYWGAQVIVNLFDAIPLIGPDLSQWIRGDYVVSDATLNRFFAFHVIAIPLVLLGLVGGAHHGAARGGLEQSRRRRDQEARRTRRPATRSTASRSTRTTRSRTRSGVVVFLIVFCAHHVLHAGIRRLLPRVQQLHTRRSAEDAGAHRAGVVFHAVLLDPARHAPRIS